LLYTLFVYQVGYGLWTQEVPPRTREVTPTISRGVYFTLCDTLLHSPLLMDLRGTPTDPRGIAHHITWCTSLRWHFAPHTCISNSSIMISMFRIQYSEVLYQEVQGLYIKGVLRVSSMKIPLSRIQEFMNISLSDNIRHYNQSSVIVSCSLYQY